MPAKYNITMRCLIIASALVAACTADAPGVGNEAPDAGVSPADAATDAGTPAACTPPTGGTAPTFTQLYTTYFAAGTPGHCATAGCHSDPGHAVWLCGTNKDTCFKGMVSVGLINTTNPAKSLIVDTTNSPLRWISTGGTMPKGAVVANDAGRDAVKAWVAACAQNN